MVSSCGCQFIPCGMTTTSPWNDRTSINNQAPESEAGFAGTPPPIDTNLGDSTDTEPRGRPEPNSQCSSTQTRRPPRTRRTHSERNNRPRGRWDDESDPATRLPVNHASFPGRYPYWEGQQPEGVGHGRPPCGGIHLRGIGGWGRDRDRQFRAESSFLPTGLWPTFLTDERPFFNGQEWEPVQMPWPRWHATLPIMKRVIPDAGARHPNDGPSPAYEDVLQSLIDQLKALKNRN